MFVRKYESSKKLRLLRLVWWKSARIPEDLYYSILICYLFTALFCHVSLHSISLYPNSSTIVFADRDAIVTVATVSFYGKRVIDKKVLQTMVGCGQSSRDTRIGLPNRCPSPAQK